MRQLLEKLFRYFGICSYCLRRQATWVYMAGGSHNIACDKCVPRGCDCWLEFVGENGKNEPPIGRVEGLDWKWLKQGRVWEELDGSGKQLPCWEWWYDASEGREIRKYYWNKLIGRKELN